MKVSKRVGNTRVARLIVDTCRTLWPHEPWDELLEGLGYQVTFEPIKTVQTDSQRGYYWRSLHFWGRELGYSAKESESWLHNAVLCEAFGVKEMRHVGRSHIEIPNLRSSRLNMDEYRVLIDTMLRMAAETGIAIPEPERAA